MMIMESLKDNYFKIYKNIKVELKVFRKTNLKRLDF